MDRKGIIAGLILGLTLAGGLSASRAADAIAAPAKAGAHSVHAVQTLPAALRPAYYHALARDAGAAYAVNRAGCASLPRQQFKACFNADGAHFKGATPLILRLTAWGRGSDLAAVTPVQPAIEGNEVNYRHGALSEWWRVLPPGFEQGFTVAKRPSGHGELTLALTMSRLEADAPAKGTVAWGKLRYGRLVVTDANGKVVPATLKAKGDRILIAVNDAHAAYPLTVDPLVWLQRQKIVAGDGVSGDEFGTAVAIEGTTALVGAPYNPNGGPGAVYVFTESNGIWTQTQKLIADDGVNGDYFGGAVALDGTTAFIGAPYVFGNGDTGGALYIFTETNGTWSKSQEFFGQGPQLQVSALGVAIAVDGSTALIGAGEYDNGNGQAVIFTGSQGGTWNPHQVLTIPNSLGTHFGEAVALDGTTALIGAQNVAVNGNDGQGAAYVFTDSNGTWTQAAELTASDGGVGDNFGNAVALEGTTALVGAFDDVSNSIEIGSAYVFNGSGSTWTQTQKLVPNDDDEDYFGWAIAMRGQTALIGATSAYGNEIYAGAVYVYTESNGTWTPSAKLTASDGQQQDELGYAVAFDGTNALVGAWEAAVNDVFDVGAAYFFDKGNLDLVLSAPANVQQGSQYISHTIATNNAATDSPEVKAKITVPSATDYVSATATQGTCSALNGVVTCDFGPIAGNGGTATANVTLKATGSPGTTIHNVARIARAMPALTASAPTVITGGQGCLDGYTEYDGHLNAGKLATIPSYQAPAGKENAILTAPTGFQLYVRFQNAHGHKQTYRIHGNEIHQHTPAGTFTWGVKAGGAGGDYTFCLKHP